MGFVWFPPAPAAAELPERRQSRGSRTPPCECPAHSGALAMPPALLPAPAALLGLLDPTLPEQVFAI